MSISVIYDDSDPNFVYYGNQWTHQTNVASSFENTLSVCDTTFHNSTTSRASFTTFFRGTDISIYGPADAGVEFNYTIDSSDPQTAQINPDAIGKRGGKIWGLVGLDNSTLHNFEFFPLAGAFKFDYMTFTPTRYTTIATSNVTLDDADDSIKYSSGWTASSSGSYGDVIPYNGTVTSTSTAGSTMNFTFFGTSISVYGLLNQNSGKLSASFSVDGGSAAVYSPFNGNQPVSASQWSLNQLYYHQSNLLELGDHTLSVKLDEATGSQALYVDSLVFTATANTPFDKADADAKAKAANTTSTTGSGFPNNNNNSNYPGPHLLSSGAIAGIVVGAFFFFFIFYFIRRKIWICINPPPSAPHVQTNTNPRLHSRSAPPPPPVRPRQPARGPLSTAEDGAAPPFDTPSPGWNSNSAPTFPTPSTEPEMRNLYANNTPIASTNPPPGAFISATRPPLAPSEPQIQDGSDGSTPPHPAAFASTAGDGLAGIAMPTNITNQQPPLGAGQASGSEKQQPVILTYPG